MYRFDFETDVEGGALGAPHAIDIAFTFGNADASALSGSRAERHAVADVVSGVWATFARTGSPQTTDLPSWSPYDTQHRATMLLDTTSRIVEDPDSTERTAWDNVAIAL
jgi:para-nitrobenzyl esterase